jgi:hypothetical protein
MFIDTFLGRMWMKTNLNSQKLAEVFFSTDSSDLFELSALKIPRLLLLKPILFRVN